MKAYDYSAGAVIFFLVCWLGMIGGWIANIVKIVGMIDSPITAMFIARCVGTVVVPLGSVLGFF